MPRPRPHLSLSLVLLSVLCYVFCGARAQCATTAPYNASSCNNIVPATATPVCLPVNDSTVQALLASYPNCAPLLDIANERGDGIWLPADPYAVNSSEWGTTSLFLRQVISGSYQFARTLGTIPAVPLTSKDCLHAYIRYTCARFFRTCDPTDPRALRRAPCQDVCSHLDSIVQNPDGSLTCRQLIFNFLTSPNGGNQSPENANFFFPPCNVCESGCGVDFSSPALYGTPSYPAASQQWDFGGGNSANVTCATFPIEAFVQNNGSRKLFPCYLPWVEAPADKNGYCGIGCPTALVDKDVYDGVATLTAVFAWISYFLTAFIIFTMIFIPRYRRFPSCMILTAAVGAHILAFGFVFTITRGFRRVTCKDSVTYRSGLGASACVFQTLAFEVGISLVCWAWACIGINSAISIGLRKDAWLRSKWCSIPQYVLVFGWPVAACIASLGIGQFASAPITIVCFTIPTNDDAQTGQWTFDWLFVYVPLGAALAVVLPSVTIALFGMRHFKDESAARVQRHIRVILFLIVFIPILLFAFIYRIYSYRNGERWGDAFRQWTQSALFAPTNPPKSSDRPSPGLFYGSFFVFSIEGALIAILFGTNKDIVHFWRAGCRRIRQGRSFLGSSSFISTEDGLESSMRSTQNQGTFMSQ